MTTSFAEWTISPERTAAFENRLQQKINQGSLAMMIALGYRTGLWKVLSQLDHATCQEIADESGLNAEYVADWLAAMLGGGLIDYDPIFQTYRLPREHAEILTSSTQYEEALRWLPLLGKLEDELAVGLAQETAVPETAGDRLLTVHTSEQSASFTNQLFQSILPLVPGLIMRLSEGLDVLDLGCGDGAVLLELAAAFPESRFVGYDPSGQLIEQARHSAISRELENVSFFQRDLTAIHAIQSFDLITAFDVNLEGSDQDRMLREVQSALRPDGILLLRELAVSWHRDENLQHPLSALLLSICSVRSLAGHAQSGKRRGKEALCLCLEAAGLGVLECHQLSQDVLHEYYIARQS
ncbi:class I SAM-dependent methyltransferase [Gimesia panareensis]|uniref:class I SAM-dependent methyltransferase n=1 Tax=Gimesia panareensis TaxID=2527978 RepID=UPI00118B36F0|nr:class I SAM-dependent methyltransferase [Gimesia panareensis]QDU53152.1 hypothetical protein Pan110_55370 [Gimesia panareensis]